MAVAARHPIDDIRSSGDLDDEHLNREPRVLTCVVNTPTPVRVWHYDYKLSFLDALTDRVRQWLRNDAHLIVAGDINVASTNHDVFHSDASSGRPVSRSRSERDALARLLDAGLVDVDVARWGPRARRFAWGNHGIGYSRNLGFGS